jgi:hypothetical protein
MACYDVHARVADMNANGVLGSICFPSFPGFVGQLWSSCKDKTLARVMLQAYNDWHIDEWTGSYPDRYIPLAMPALWDPQLMAEEVRRVARRGCTAVSITENPEKLKLPSDVFREHIFNCFIDDKAGVRMRDLIGVDTIMWECDYPHSDTTWPRAPETLWESLDGVSDDDINAMTHENAMRAFAWDFQASRPRERCTVSALRTEAVDVDLSLMSGAGGMAPHEEGRRIVTAGDIMKQLANALVQRLSCSSQSIPSDCCPAAVGVPRCCRPLCPVSRLEPLFNVPGRGCSSELPQRCCGIMSVMSSTSTTEIKPNIGCMALPPPP